MNYELSCILNLGFRMPIDRLSADYKPAEGLAASGAALQQRLHRQLDHAVRIDPECAQRNISVKG